MAQSDGLYSTGVQVLFAGDYWPGSNTIYIADAFKHCGAIVRFFNRRQITPVWASRKGKLARKLLYHAVMEAEWNEQFLALVDKIRPDLVYISMADLCWPRTIQAIKDRGIPVMCFYHDVVWRRSDRRFDEVVGQFDLVVTTRAWQVDEFKAAGAKNVATIRFGCEPSSHAPVELAPLAVQKYGADVTFIGTQEKKRTADLELLVGRDFPHGFRLWGYWDKLPGTSPLARYWQGRDVNEQEIPVIYAASKIALHWVAWEPESSDRSLQKGDQHNSRTFQIGACGTAMMLAQRTAEHRLFFTEDVEAVYFDDVQELRGKLAYWLDPARDEQRRAIAAAARARCLRDDYSYVPVVRGFLEHFGLPCRRAT